MFDIGFAELVLIAIVGLMVIGPERLPGAIRTVSLWLNRLKRGFNDIKREVEQELHNDAVMTELRKAGEELKGEADGLSQDIQATGDLLVESTADTASSASDAKKPKQKTAQARRQTRLSKHAQKLREQEKRLEEQEQRLQELEQKEARDNDEKSAE